MEIHGFRLAGFSASVFWYRHSQVRILPPQPAESSRFGPGKNGQGLPRARAGGESEVRASAGAGAPVSSAGPERPVRDGIADEDLGLAKQDMGVETIGADLRRGQLFPYPGPFGEILDDHLQQIIIGPAHM